MAREVFHDNDGDWEGSTPTADKMTFVTLVVALAIEGAAIWAIWHYCKVKGWL